MISTHLIALLALAASLPLSESKVLERESLAPPITYPTADTTWYGGTLVNVSWDTSNIPTNTVNPLGEIYLVANGVTQGQDELAWGFEFTTGYVDFYVPDVLTGVYQVLLFGDSGDISPAFNIIHQ